MYQCDGVRRKFGLLAICCKDCHAQEVYYDYALPGLGVMQVCCAVQNDMDEHAEDIKHKLASV